MGLEGLDRPLCLVAPVLPRGNKFICYAVALDACHCHRAFVVEYMFLIPKPAAFIQLIIFWYTLIISPSVLFFIGLAKM